MNSIFLGVDIGTSGVKAVAFTAEGTQVGLCSREYPLLCSQKDMAEIDPGIIFASFAAVVKGCLETSRIAKNGLAAIGISTQLFSIMAVDRDGENLTNLFTWADTRSLREAEQIGTASDYQWIYNHTGCRGQHPMYPLSKIRWLRAAQPELEERIFKYISIKEYILYQLYGEYLIDITDASTTGFFNIHRFEWDADILRDILKIGQEKLGECVDCTCILRNMRPEYAAAMGIDAATPVVIGSGDGMLANLGCGIFDNTVMSCTVGTSGALRVAIPRPLLDPLQRTWCYCFTRDTWVAGGAINNAGIVLRWLRDEYRDQFEQETKVAGLTDLYQLFDRYAAEIPPGCEGLVFLPFLTGERSPNWNAKATGTLHGLKLFHGKKHLIRAAMEGVMYRMFSVYEVLIQLNGAVGQITANGGYVKSDLWLQIQADIFNREIVVAPVGEAASFGAAYLAMVALGAIGDVKTLLPGMRPSKILKPDAARHQLYQPAYAQFKEIYRRLYNDRSS